MTDRRDPDVHRMVMDWPDDAVAEIESLRAENKALKHNIDAYRGALGYPVRGDHDGRLTDGTIPQCGLCDARERARENKEDERRFGQPHYGHDNEE